MTDDQTQDFMQDKLFIETGEDVEDIMLAWKFYKLNWVKSNLHKKVKNSFVSFKFVKT